MLAANFLLPWVFAVAVTALPSHSVLYARDDSISSNDDPLVFDAAGFPDPMNLGQTLAGLQSFVSLHPVDLGVIKGPLSAALKAIGLSAVADDITTAANRLKLAAVIPRSGKQVEVNIDGCNKQLATVGPTSGSPDLGMALKNVSLGTCDGSNLTTGTVQLGSSDKRNFQFSVFNSPDSGFGVISDVDDTVKITNVLDKIEALKATLFEGPQPVAGMPQLYASLTKSLHNPAFFYISGSPFQLYPFLHDFIGTTYSASRGPIFLQNLTLIDIPALIDFTKVDGIQVYKDQMIDRIRGMYPHKKYLMIGDSTQRDPESYGDAFRKYGGDTISCIWIRLVDGANNTDARFAAAFQGVPQNRIQLYNDAQIPALQNVNVSGGRCTL
ncbi:hypothetical protein BDN72DRAFT_757269 [Pluteus cervinus]|uniref:Uncharacterized protein n=1 Tax=Pluteus cervinus TaxID=181527 RepID=A0ACD3BDN1_9AGAR|nr:hypothetical protein BDN72DRAFT_757269 [Pluteus cervinus]